MSFADLLIHDIAIERPFRSDVLDDYGHAERTYETTAMVRGQIQPKTTGREVQYTSEAGPEIGLYTGFFGIDTDLTHADRLRFAETGEVFEVKRVRAIRFGSVPHLEVDCDLITSDEDPDEVGS